jgi:hypothetical protein
MDRALGLYSALAMDRMTAVAALAVRPVRDDPAGVRLTGPGPASSTSPPITSPAVTTAASIGPGPASTGLSPHDRHDRMAERMNDVVIRRIFAAGLDLQAALGLIGEHRADTDHRAAGKIGHASDELDHAIRDLRDILFERDPD